MKGLALLSLEGKRALVTGAGTGLGRSLARGLSEAGAEVVICGRRPEHLDGTVRFITEVGGTCEVVVADVTKEEDVQRLVEAVGRIDILVNNAAIAPDEAWLTVPLDSWREVIEINLLAPFRLCQVFSPQMMERGWGRIINIASVYGSIAGKPALYPDGWDPASYFATKHGIHGITRYLAVRLAPHGVNINSLSPGGVITEDHAAKNAAGKTDEELRAEDERIARFTSSEVPLGRVGGEDDYTAPVVFLASPGARYMTGQNLIVDGGWTVW